MEGVTVSVSVISNGVEKYFFSFFSLEEYNYGISMFYFALKGCIFRRCNKVYNL